MLRYLIAASALLVLVSAKLTAKLGAKCSTAQRWVWDEDLETCYVQTGVCDFPKYYTDRAWCHHKNWPADRPSRVYPEVFLRSGSCPSGGAMLPDPTEVSGDAAMLAVFGTGLYSRDCASLTCPAGSVCEPISDLFVACCKV